MHSVETLYLVALCGPALGLVAGYLFAKRRGPTALKQRQLQQQIEELTQHQQQYQQQVADHFSKTAQLVNTMTNSYRDVHNHLAAGAQLLAGGQADTALIALDNEPMEPDIALLAIEQDSESINGATAAEHTGPILDEAAVPTATQPSRQSTGCDDSTSSEADSAFAANTNTDKSATATVKTVNSDGP